MKIKKHFKDLVEFLEENRDKKVSTVLPMVLEMAKAKINRDPNAHYIKDATGKVVAVRCAYFKLWLPVCGEHAVDFSEKKGSGSGYNTMCKIGSNAWFKRKKTERIAKDQLLKEIVATQMSPKEVDKRTREIEAEASSTIEPPFEVFHETLEDMITYLESIGHKVRLQ